MAGSSDSQPSDGQQTFRAHAVDHLRSPERLDQVVSVTRMRTWIAVVAGLVATAVFFWWATVATIPVRTTVPGLMTRSGAFSQAFAPVAGRVASVAVAPGDRVRQGDTIATITPESGPPATVEAPSDGIVQGLAASSGEPVEASASLATLVAEDSDAALQAITYVNATDALALSSVSQVTVQPITVDTSLYGSLVGTVSFVADLPATRAEMTRQLESEAVATSFLETTEVAYLVVVSFDDPVRWTDGPAPPFAVTDGTSAELSAIVEQYKPLDLIF